MQTMGVPTPARIYQDFEPSMEWVPEDDSDTLLVYLPGFAKEQLRVQLRARNLIISGERKLQENNTWSRFRVEFPVSVNCDLNKISAKFEGNILFVRQPKLITQIAKTEQQEEDKKAAAAVVAAPLPTPDQKPMNDELNEAQKPLLPDTKDDKLEEPKEVPKMMGLKEPKTTSAEEEGVNAADKKTSALWDNNNNNNNKAELDKTTKTALENYKRAIGVFSSKLKTSRNAVNTIVILLVGLVIGIYVSDSIKSWTNKA